MPGLVPGHVLTAEEKERTWMAGTTPGHDGKGGCFLDRPLGLRAVVTLDDHEVGFGIGAAQRDQAHIFRRIVAGQRGFIILEFQHHVARARGAFSGHVLAAAHQEPGAVFRKYRAVLRDVFLVAVHVVNIDTRDPVAFAIGYFPLFQASACTISAWMASATALASAASITGRPTTR